MKVLFFQQRREQYFSVQILFDTIRKNLPASIEQKVLFFSHSGLSTMKKIQHFIEVCRSEKGDINHIVEEINYAALIIDKEKTILTIHDIIRLYNTKGFKNLMFKWFWLKLPVARAGIITAISHTTKEEILKYVNCAPSKIRVIYNCISPKFVPVPSSFNKEKPVLLQIGAKPHKNLDRVIKAIEGVSCKLNIVGKPADATLELLRKHNIDFSWKSGLTESEMVQQYVDCDVVIFASEFEGFGVPIIEANATERVVVTSNCSAMKEVAGDAACLVDPFDVASISAGIKRVIDDDEYREKLLTAGRLNRMRFDAKVIADQYAELYEEVHSKNNGQ